jgi:putative glutamine amidotransferase
MRDRKIAPYEAALRFVGLDFVRIPPSSPIPGFDGLLLTGGTDLSPSFYGQRMGQYTQPPDGPRDGFEWSLLAAVLDAGVPVFAICRGMQMFNVRLGGTLHQHVEGHQKKGVNNAHGVEVVVETRLAGIVGAGPHNVNSRHHQAVDRIGEGLVGSARSEDGIIEGLELPGHRFAVAVQWHPEDRIHSSGCDLRLFQAFAATLNS